MVTTDAPSANGTSRDSLLQILRPLLTMALLFSLAVSGSVVRADDGPTSRNLSPVGSPPVASPSVEGVVTGVNGALVSLFDDAIVIDTSSAAIVVVGSEGRDSSSMLKTNMINVGDRLLATGLTPLPTAGIGFPALKASFVTVTPGNTGLLAGTIQGFDVSGGFFSILSHNVLVDASTQFSGDAKSLSDLAAGQTAIVTVTKQTLGLGQPLLQSGTTLLALSVEVRNPHPLPLIFFRGPVESIGATQWQIAGHIVLVVSDTKIVGDPKVGDVVQVLAKVDSSSGILTALSIVTSSATPPPDDRGLEFDGTVQAIPSVSPLGHWKVSGRDVLVTSLTRIEGSPSVGDHVHVRGSFQPVQGATSSAPVAMQFVASSIQKL